MSNVLFMNPPRANEVLGSSGRRGRGYGPAVAAAIASPGRWVVRHVRPLTDKNKKALWFQGYGLRKKQVGGYEWEVAVRIMKGADFPKGVAVDEDVIALFIRTTKKIESTTDEHSIQAIADSYFKSVSDSTES